RRARARAPLQPSCADDRALRDRAQRPSRMRRAPHPPGPRRARPHRARSAPRDRSEAARPRDSSLRARARRARASGGRDRVRDPWARNPGRASAWHRARRAGGRGGRRGALRRTRRRCRSRRARRARARRAVPDRAERGSRRARSPRARRRGRPRNRRGRLPRAPRPPGLRRPGRGRSALLVEAARRPREPSPEAAHRSARRARPAPAARRSPRASRAALLELPRARWARGPRQGVRAALGEGSPESTPRARRTRGRARPPPRFARPRTLASGRVVPDRVLLAVEAEQDRLAIGARRDAHRPPPDADERAQGFTGVVGPEVDAAMIVVEQELPAVLEVRVLDVDDGVSEIRELREQLLLHRAELARLDLVALAPARPVVREELVLDRELLGQELVDERDVGVERAHLEDLVPAET